MRVSFAAKRDHARTPLWVRIFHVLIALLFLALTYSGIVLTFSHSDFALLDYELASTTHEVTGVAFSVLYVLFVVLAAASGYWRVYGRRVATLRDRMGRPLARAVRAREGDRRLEASTQFLVQFQTFAYLAAMAVLMPLLIGTGLVYLYPETSPETVSGHAGLWPLALGHYITGLLGVLFLLIHVYISTIAGFRRIIFGR